MNPKAEKLSLKEDLRDTDQELIEACLKGDHLAWETLIVKYQRLIYSIPIKIGLSPEDSADVFQSVCLKLVEGLSRLRNQERLASWLITSTTRESWRVSGSKRRMTSIDIRDDDGVASPEPVASGPLPSETHIHIEQQQIVREAVAGLPVRCRDLITMLFYEKDELKYSDIAQRMNIPPSSVGPTRARCLEKLKRILNGKI